MIFALPNRGTGRATQGVDAFGGGGFERTDNGGNGTGYGGTKSFQGDTRAGCRGTAAPCPYDVVIIHNPNDAMHVIGHDHEFIIVQSHMRADLRGLQPFLAHNFALRVQPHLTINHFAKEAHAVLRDDGNKIRLGLGIIISLQPAAAAVVFFGIVFYRFFLFGRITILGEL